MRAQLLLVGMSLAGSIAGCKWTDFDDLEQQTWVRSTEDPEIGSTEYAVAIVDGTESASGGTLAVLSEDTPRYSTISYNSASKAVVDASPRISLNEQNINLLSEAPVFVASGDGRIALIERAATGNLSVLFGQARTPVSLELFPATTPAPQPEAALFVGTALLFAAGDTLYTLPASGGVPITCTATDHMGMPLQVAGMGADANTLWVWTKGGALVSYPLAALDPCTGGTAPAPTTAFSTAGFMPGAGARVFVEGAYAVLAGTAAASRMGRVYVVDLAGLTQVGTELEVEGLRSSTMADLGGARYLALGVPDRSVAGVVAGEVDVYELTPATGVLSEAPVISLHDADPESGQLFGRTITTMQFAGNQILAVGAKDEVFAYFRTALYDHLP